MNYKEEKKQILREAGVAQHKYWTTLIEQYSKFPSLATSISKLSTTEGEKLWAKAKKDMETKEYKEMQKEMQEADRKFYQCKNAYEQLSRSLVKEGVLKRGLNRDFYGEMISVMDKKLASEMMTAKHKYQQRRDNE